MPRHQRSARKCSSGASHLMLHVLKLSIHLGDIKWLRAGSFAQLYRNVRNAFIVIQVCSGQHAAHLTLLEVSRQTAHRWLINLTWPKNVVLNWLEQKSTTYFIMLFDFEQIVWAGRSKATLSKLTMWSVCAHCPNMEECMLIRSVLVQQAQTA